MNKDNLRKKFEESGHLSLKNSIDISLLDDLHNLVCELVLVSAERLNPEQRAEFKSKNFTHNQIPHEGLLLLSSLDPKSLQFVVDAANNSFHLSKLAVSGCVVNKAAHLIGGDGLMSLNINQLRLRVDLPERFKENKEKVHLGYHQESGYFSVNVSQNTGIVAWIPLYDCRLKQGALRVLPYSHLEKKIVHDIHYEDPIKKRQKRAIVPKNITDKYNEISLDSEKGDLTFQNFNLIHRSGDNETYNYVRYSVVVRYSNLFARDFLPVSWT